MILRGVKAQFVSLPVLVVLPALAALVLVLLSGCADEQRPPARAEPTVTKPPAGASFDYQLGGDYAPPQDARVVVRQWDSEPAENAYSICYVNAFQTEADGPDGPASWPEGTVWKHSEDPAWPGEYPIDISSASKREAAAQFVTARFETCASQGFSAVELDNLDSFARYADAPFDRRDAMEYASMLVDAASGLGLAVGQKNAVDLLDAASDIGFTFAIVEECGAYDECREYLGRYENRVYAVEYTQEGFSAACAAVQGSYGVILRDLDLTANGEPGYIRERC